MWGHWLTISPMSAAPFGFIGVWFCSSTCWGHWTVVLFDPCGVTGLHFRDSRLTHLGLWRVVLIRRPIRGRWHVVLFVDPFGVIGMWFVRGPIWGHWLTISQLSADPSGVLGVWFCSSARVGSLACGFVRSTYLGVTGVRSRNCPPPHLGSLAWGFVRRPVWGHWRVVLFDPSMWGHWHAFSRLSADPSGVFGVWFWFVDPFGATGMWFCSSTNLG